MLWPLLPTSSNAALPPQKHTAYGLPIATSLSNKPLTKKAAATGGSIFGDSIILTAILDRLLHHSRPVNIRAESSRLAQNPRRRCPNCPANVKARNGPLDARPCEAGGHRHRDSATVSHSRPPKSLEVWSITAENSRWLRRDELLGKRRRCGGPRTTRQRLLPMRQAAVSGLGW